jgi:hypothetical protein
MTIQDLGQGPISFLSMALISVPLSLLFVGFLATTREKTPPKAFESLLTIWQGLTLTSLSLYLSSFLAVFGPDGRGGQFVDAANFISGCVLLLCLVIGGFAQILKAARWVSRRVESKNYCGTGGRSGSVETNISEP